jgi:putative cell wall-binding protein
MSVDGRVLNIPSDVDVGLRPGVERSLGEAVGIFYDVNDVATRRLSGGDRIDTAILLSHERPSASRVILATSTGYPDALVGGPLAAQTDAPLLLTGPGGLDSRVIAEMARLGATSATVLGGTAALGPQIDADLAARNIAEQRIAGADRYATAAAVAAAIPRKGTVLVASGENYPDALSAGAVGLPVLLTARTALPDATRAAIGADKPVLVGGAVAIDPAVLPGSERLSGADRYGTSAAVADWGVSHGLYGDARVLVARGDAFPDALVGGALHRPLLLVAPLSLDESGPTRDWLGRHGGPITEAILLGGRTALSTMSEVQVDALVAP